MSKGFVHTDMAGANEECGRRDQQYIDTCPECKMKVGLHCHECKLQVTGCLCVEIERFGKNEAIQRLYEREGEIAAREKLERAGLWLPGMN